MRKEENEIYNELKKAQIIVATCTSLGRIKLSFGCVSSCVYWLRTVIVDECPRGLETETLVPMVKGVGRAVLLGDLRQPKALLGEGDSNQPTLFSRLLSFIPDQVFHLKVSAGK